jgi:hypothetical protein
MNALLGPTLPPRIKGNIAVTSYEGVDLVFNYNASAAQGVDFLSKAKPAQLDSLLINSDNQLAKITISGGDECQAQVRATQKRGNRKILMSSCYFNSENIAE